METKWIHISKFDGKLHLDGKEVKNIHIIGTIIDIKNKTLQGVWLKIKVPSLNSNPDADTGPGL